MSKTQDIARNVCVDYSKYIVILDMGLLWRLSILSSGDRGKVDGIVYIWKYYWDEIFETVLMRYPSASLIIAVNDYYGNDVINVKGGEP